MSLPLSTLSPSRCRLQVLLLLLPPLILTTLPVVVSQQLLPTRMPLRLDCPPPAMVVPAAEEQLCAGTA